ncbi:MAG: hypothetical protein R2939_06665 [Kofleriaceae bacterium]
MAAAVLARPRLLVRAAALPLHAGTFSVRPARMSVVSTSLAFCSCSTVQP